MSGAFIGDVETGYLAEIEGLHPECRFTYVPLLIEERSAFLERLDKCKDKAQQDRISALELEKVLRTWSLAKPDGGLVPITAKNILRLKYRLFNELQSIALFGLRGSDNDPSKPVEEKLSVDLTEVVSAINGTDLNSALEEARIKN